jgi:hypothetical protein
MKVNLNEWEEFEELPDKEKIKKKTKEWNHELDKSKETRKRKHRKKGNDLDVLF